MRQYFITIVFILCHTVLFAQPNAVESCRNQIFVADSLSNTLKHSEYLQSFFEKMKDTSEHQLTVLHIGDSHIQMGYFVQEMRNQFAQNIPLSAYGSFFPYPIAKYRPFYVSNNVLEGQWDGKNILTDEDSYKYGISGFTAMTKSKKASLALTLKQCQEEIMSGNKVVVYFKSSSECLLTLKGINLATDSTKGILPKVMTRDTVGSEQNGWKKLTAIFPSSIHKIILTIENNNDSSGFSLFDLQLLNTQRQGLVYHNVGVGGAQFNNFIRNTSMSVSQIKDIKPDLIIFSYGANEAYTSKYNDTAFYEMIASYIDNVKKACPDVSILFTSPSDARATNRFPVNITSIRSVYSRISTDKKTAYWDLFAQMGGNGSIFNWLKKGWASSDKLHFTKSGYELQARLLCDAIFRAYNESYPSAIQWVRPNLHYYYHP